MEVSWKLVKGEVRQQLMHQGDQKGLALPPTANTAACLPSGAARGPKSPEVGRAAWSSGVEQAGPVMIPPQLFQVVLLLLLAPALISCRVAEYPTDCSQIHEIGDYHQSGSYSIQPAGENLQVEVYCQMSPDQPAWTVIQTRMDGTVNFYRPWIQYKVGFGSVRGEHWLGLDNLHYLTSGPTKFELQVDMEDFEGNKASAHYRMFSVDSECNGYTLSVSGFTDKGAGDSMMLHNGMKFSTFDRDQDMWPENCASTFMGGFWYNNCHHANPNGIYRWGQEKTPYATGVSWLTWKKTYDYSVKSIVMKVRPVQPE